MQKFYTQTIESLFIQNLLTNTPLPIYNTKRDGDFIVKGYYYVYNHEIIKCTRSGFILKNATTPLFPAEKLYPRNDLYPSDGTPKAEYTISTRYEFGKYYPKITYKFKPKTNYYDPDTHYELGKYLRCIRNTYDVDFMPFYNCYNAKNIPNIIIGPKTVEGENKNNLLVVPILFNTPYTISISSKYPVSMKAIKYGYKYMGDQINNSITYLNANNEEITYGTYDANPFTQLGIPGTNRIYYHGIYTQDPKEIINERFLYLCFQGKEIEGLSVVEGNYSQSEFKAAGYQKFVEESPNIISKLKLLDSTDDFYAFSDRLVEGLLNNIITKQEEIYWNIGMLQEALGQEKTNIWDDRIRIDLFNKYMSSKDPYLTKYDITGNGDKDTEFFLLRGTN